MLDVTDLDLHYGHSQILDTVSMSARAGEVTCVMGTNGVGKTSLLKALSGRHPASRGRIMLDGDDIGGLSAHGMARAGGGYVPQGREVFPLLTVRENLETAFAGLPRARRRVSDDIFELFPVLHEMRHRRGGDLSGGQQQQLSIARALILRPRLLLLDEPTEGIQPNIIAQIGRVIAKLRDRGDMAIVLVEQYFDFAHDLADSFVVMRRGRVTLAGARDAVTRDRLLSEVSV